MVARHFLYNPGFELGNVGWTLDGTGTIVNDAGNALSGAYVLRHIGDGTNDNHDSWHSAATQRILEVRPGGVLNCECYVKDGTAGDARVRLRYYDKDGVFLSNSNGNSVGFGNSSYVQSILTSDIVPSLAKFADVSIQFTTSPTGTWYADDFDAWGDWLENIPSTVLITNHRLIESVATAVFPPLIGSPKYQDFNAGMSDRWAGTFTFAPDLPEDDLGDLIAWIGRLGKTNGFLAYDPDRTAPKNGVVNGMTVDGAGQAGTKLAIKDAPTPSVTALVAGDYIEVADQYYRLQRDLVIGPASTGVAHIWPAIRTSPADDEPVITDNPKMVARITSDVPRSSDHTKWTELTISWEEVG